jgi:acetyltransferase-like isoleucine patch superfamily enzyme
MRARVLTSRLQLGDNSWIASGAILRGDISVGSNTSINPFAHIAGRVTIGSHVRIAGMVSIYGFNHGFKDINVPICDQPASSEGVWIGDDVWIGANAVIVDGCRIGAHCVIGAGAVVTKDIPEYQVVAGTRHAACATGGTGPRNGKPTFQPVPAKRRRRGPARR